MGAGGEDRRVLPHDAEAYNERFFEMETSPASANLRRRVSRILSLMDLDVRFRQLDEFGFEYRQVINIC